MSRSAHTLTAAAIALTAFMAADAMAALEGSRLEDVDIEEAARAALEKAQEGIDRTEAGHELSAAEAMLAAAEGGPRH